MLITSSEVHVWRADLDRPSTEIEQFIQVLAPDERQRSERFRFEKDRKKFIVARGLLRTILSRYLSHYLSYGEVTSPAQVVFSYGNQGKPAIANPYPAGELCFNISHSHSMALYAIALNHQVGIDLEYIRPIDAIALAQRFFLLSEIDVMRSLPETDQHSAFFKFWTQKEAYLKATGDGLGRLESVEVALTEPMGLVSVDGNPQIAAQWFVQEIVVNPACPTDYAAALVIQGTPPNLHYFSI
ncbi:MAG: 4'-phosphopantetheinyl transferase superfamily protein [Leptolyngbyaceae cyanobacterium CSU_1_4]|nr:4'-phosphopantetheinyl transferase superfamily protein [Leptolyngbyaceae cyanobacterium CSU_1_4]